MLWSNNLLRAALRARPWVFNALRKHALAAATSRLTLSRKVLAERRDRGFSVLQTAARSAVANAHRTMISRSKCRPLKTGSHAQDVGDHDISNGIVRSRPSS